MEGLPLIVVEVQASGLPCLVSDAVTGEVKLTDLVMYLSLEQSNEEWTEKILAYANDLREGATEQNQRQLKRFDSAAVAQEIQEFYLRL